MAIPQKVDRRILEGIQRYRPILEQAKARDVNEADTVTIVKGQLADIFGWDPFFDVTAEYAIKCTYCDLAVKQDDRIQYLLEVKAIGSDLRENHLRQAVGYAANQGVEWVVLTNAAVWQVHRVTFGKPIGNELVFQIDFLSGSHKDAKLREQAFLLSKEGVTKSAIAAYHEERLALSKFNLAAVLRDEDVLMVVRREFRRAFPNLNPSLDQLRSLLENDVLKREVVEGEKAEAAIKLMNKARRSLRKSPSEKKPNQIVAPPASPVP
jgi:hypothetical protein